MQMMKARVTSVREVAADIVEFRLVAANGQPLAPFTPGAHVHVAVPSGGTRQYSLCNDPAEADAYVLAVKREPEGQGGSVSLVEKIRAGDEIDISEPRNDFELRTDVSRVILIAGGIGITPILCMARVLNRRGEDFHLYYLTRSPELTAFRDEILASPFADRVTFHHDYGDPTRSLDLGAILADPGDAVVYCCGPSGLLRAVREQTAHWPKGSVRFEDFGTSAPSTEPNSESFTVTLADGRGSYLVPPDKTILQVLQEAGLDMPSSCEAGTCGTCRMRLLSGEADHRDLVLFDDEMDGNIIICCSRAKSAEIVIAPPD
jgi:phthalate 4,5-dioxygenase reductase subunit